MTLAAEAEINYFARNYRRIPSDVVAEQVMREQQIAGTPKHLTQFGKLDLRVKDGWEKGIRPAFSEVSSGAAVRPRPDPQVVHLLGRLIGQEDAGQ